ncbi:MAG: tetrahydromethanopterin S-methyltransferase subunit C, partial [Methanobacterium sp.]|nr:tetrahydromethanopterin S-methyltransferase subunit C [Methanobacterium sp.]
TGFASMAIVGLLGLATSPTWWLVALIGAIGWFVAISSFIKASIDEAASVKWTGIWPKEEEH